MWFWPTTLAAAVLGGFFLYWRGTRKRTPTLKPPAGADPNKQSVPVEGKPGVYKCGYLLDGKETVTYLYPEVTTLYDVFLRGLQVSENGRCLGTRSGADAPYQWLSYAEVRKKAIDFGAALVGRLEQQPGNDTRLGIYAKNSPSWFISALGAVTQSAVVVPLYDTLGADAVSFIVQQAEIEVVVADDATKAKTLIKAKKEKEEMRTLKHVVLIEAAVDEQLKKAAEEVGVEVHSFSELLDEGSAHPVPLRKPDTDDLYIICYTSGTTGTPKGVMLTHKNLVSNQAAFAIGFTAFLPGDQAINESDVLISYLPLSHMMEQMAHWSILEYGAAIGYFRGDIKGLTSDIQALKPTIFPVVPRLLNRLYDLIEAKTSSLGALGRLAYKTAYAAKLRDIKAGIVSRDTIWDRLIFGKIQAQLGGRVRLMCTGSAPISAQVLETCRVAFGAVIVEAYGQTECAALATATWPGDAEGGHCGGPAACALIKLGDVPELNYFAKDGKGEILIKGPSVTQGYFRDPEKTAELFDEDGFLRTGDIGQIRENGSIKIIDRKKHIFKLAQGEYVAPEKIEQIYTRAPIVQQVYVDGDSMQRWLIAVVVPDEEALKEWAQKNGLGGKSVEELCKEEKVAEYVLDQMVKIGKQNGLNSIEQVKKVIIEPEPFSVENNLLTPTLKSKRPQLRQKYKEAMDEIYKANPKL